MNCSNETGSDLVDLISYNRFGESRRIAVYYTGSSSYEEKEEYKRNDFAVTDIEGVSRKSWRPLITHEWEILKKQLNGSSNSTLSI